MCFAYVFSAPHLVFLLICTFNTSLFSKLIITVVLGCLLSEKTRNFQETWAKHDETQGNLWVNIILLHLFMDVGFYIHKAWTLVFRTSINNEQVIIVTSTIINLGSSFENSINKSHYYFWAHRSVLIVLISPFLLLSNFWQDSYGKPGKKTW